MTPEIKDLLERLKDYMEDRSDADEGHPNAEMRFEMEIGKALTKFSGLEMSFPLSVDKTPNGKIVKRAEIGHKGYGENVEYFLNIQYYGNRMFIGYSGEDGDDLSEEEVAASSAL